MTDPAPPDKPYRKNLRRQEDPSGEGRGWRFVTFSTYRRQPLLVPLPITPDFSTTAPCAAHFVHTLNEARSRLGFRLFAYVVMPEHVHLLLEPAGAGTYAKIASSLKIPVAKFTVPRFCCSEQNRVPCETSSAPSNHDSRKAESRGTKNRFWQHGGGFDRNVRDLTEFTSFVQYIHRNPVERGLIPTPQAWPWSSIRWWMGQRAGEVECDPPPGKIDWTKWRGFM